MRVYEEDLKPCPFCGGMALFQRRILDRDMHQLCVRCNRCDAESPGGLISMDRFAEEDELQAAEICASGKWNMRK